MEIAAILLGPNPLKWKQTSPIFLLPHVVRPPLLTKPIKFSAATFNNEQAFPKFNVKLKCFFSSSAEEKSHLSCSSSSFSPFSSYSSSSLPPLGRVGGTSPWPSGVEPPETEFGIAAIGAFGFVMLAWLVLYRKSYWFSVPFCGFLAFCLAKMLYDVPKTSVVKLQVGLLGTERTLQRNLNQIAQTANTSTVKGLSYVLTETTIALLRHSDYCIAGYSFVAPEFGIYNAQACFNQFSFQERLTFDEETFVNINDIKTQNSTSQRTNGFHNQYIVVTILLAIRGEYKLPTINSSADLKEALQKLASLNEFLAVEVLWTPQNETSTLLEEQLLKSYPLLKNF